VGTSQKISNGCPLRDINEYFLGKTPFFGQLGVGFGYDLRLELSRFD
jgi:hypothetical protein